MKVKALADRKTGRIHSWICFTNAGLSARNVGFQQGLTKRYHNAKLVFGTGMPECGVKHILNVFENFQGFFNGHLFINIKYNALDRNNVAFRGGERLTLPAPVYIFERYWVFDHTCFV
jgi:hypothetical protein